MIEVLVLCRGGKSTITFDALPTYAKFRKAIAVDIVGHDTFQINATTQRGTAVVVKDQASFIRALGPRNNLTVTIREQLEVESGAAAAPVPTSQRAASTAPPPADAPAPSHAPAAGAPPPRRTATPSVASTAASERRSSPSPSRRSRTVPQTTDIPSKHGLQCGAVLESAGEARCATLVKPTNTVWTGERTTGNISVRDATKGTTVKTITPWRTLSGPQHGCMCLVHVPATRTAGSGTVWAGFNNKQIKVFDADSFTELATLIEHSGAVVALEFAAGYVFSASVDFTILQWNTETLTMSRLLARHRNGVRSLATGPMQRVVSGGDDGAFIVWHAQTGELIAEIQDAHACGIHALAFHRKRLWTGDERGSVKVWSYTAAPGTDESGALGSLTFTCVAQHVAHDGSVTGIRGFNDKVVSCGQDRTIQVYDADRFTALGQVLHPHDSPVSSIVPVAAAQVFRFWTGGSDGKWCSWSLESALAAAAAGGGDITAAPSALPSIDPSRSATPARAIDVDAEREQAWLLAFTRFEADQLQERALLVVAEAKARLDTVLLSERVTRERFFVSHGSAAAHAAEFALQAHAKSAAEALDTFALSCDFVKEQISLATATAMVSNAQLEQQRANFDKARRDADRARALQQEQLQAAHEELAATHDELEAAVERRDALERSLRDGETRSTGLAEDLRRSRDEHQAAVRRAKTFEEQLQQAQADSLATRRQHDEALSKVEAECQARVDDLVQRNASLAEQVDAAEREERRRRQELTAEKENSEAVSKRLAQQVELNKAAEERRAEASERDKAFWQKQIEAAETEIADLKSRLEEQSNDTTGEIARLTAEARDLRAKNRQAHDDVSTAQRRLQTVQAESAAEISALREQLDEVRAAWRKEIEDMDTQLRDKSAKLAAAEAATREKDSTVASIRASQQTVQHKLDLAQSDISRLNDAHAAELDEVSARLTASEELCDTLKSDVAALEATATAERAAKNDAELRLTALEDSYEALRRRSAEELQASRDTHVREASALAAKYKNLCDESEATQRDLTTELQATRVQLSQQEHAYATLQTDLAAAQEVGDATQRKLTTSQQQLVDAEARARDEASQLRRQLEAKKRELDETRDAGDVETARLRDEIQRRTATEEELAEAMRSVDAKLSACKSELDAERRKCADLTNDFRRLSERATAERKSGEERETNINETVIALRKTAGDLQSELDVANDQREAVTRQKKDAEASLAAARDELARATVRHQTLLAERDVAIEQLRNQCRENERELHTARTQAHELEADLAHTKRQHATETEDAKRNARAEVDDMRDQRTRAEQQLKRAQEQLLALKDDHDQLRIATDRRQHELEATITDHVATTGRLQSELQDAKSSLAQERERSAREVRALRDNLEEQTKQVQTERKKYESAVEERRQADKRFADAMEAHRQQSSKETDALQDALQAAKTQHAEDGAEAEGVIKGLREQTVALQNEVEGLRVQVDEKSKALQVAEHEAAHRGATHQSELDGLRRQLQQAENSAHEERQRLQRDVDGEREKVEKERSANVELNATIRQLETTAATLRVELDREQRKASDLAAELRRTQERASLDKEQAEGRYRELQTAHADAVDSTQELRDQLDERAVELMKLETSSKDAGERQRQLVEQVDTWKRRASEATIAKERVVAEAAAERAQVEERRLEEANEAHEAQAKAQEAVHEANRKAEELDRENVRLRRAMLEVQQESEDSSKKSIDAVSAADLRHQQAIDEVDALRTKYTAAIDERRRAIELANDNELTAKSLQRRLSDAEARADAEAAAHRNAAETYTQCIAGIEDDCRSLRDNLVGLQDENERLQAVVDGVTQERLQAQRNIEHALAVAEDATQAVEAKKLFVDEMAAQLELTIRQVRDDCQREIDMNNEKSATVADETRRLTTELLALREERDAVRRAQEQGAQLLDEVRDEISALYRKYKAECDDHDKTRAKLVAANVRVPRTPVDGAQEVQAVAQRELELALRGKIQALEADRDAAQAKCDSLLAELRDAHRASNTSLGPHDRFILSTRQELVRNLHDLVSGLGEAARLMTPVCRTPSETPDLETLTCVHGWMSSAKTRGELMERTLLSDSERALVKAGSASRGSSPASAAAAPAVTTPSYRGSASLSPAASVARSVYSPAPRQHIDPRQ